LYEVGEAGLKEKFISRLGTKVTIKGFDFLAGLLQRRIRDNVFAAPLARPHDALFEKVI